jgi:hypothetical protein
MLSRFSMACLEVFRSAASARRRRTRRRISRNHTVDRATSPVPVGPRKTATTGSVAAVTVTTAATGRLLAKVSGTVAQSATRMAIGRTPGPSARNTASATPSSPSEAPATGGHLGPPPAHRSGHGPIRGEGPFPPVVTGGVRLSQVVVVVLAVRVLAAAAAGRMRYAVHAEWTKLRTLPATGWLMLGVVLINGCRSSRR